MTNDSSVAKMTQQRPPGREIPCARCGKPTLFTSTNPFRPFCSERCKLIDLGNWAEGKYNIPVSNTAVDTSTDDVDNQDPTSNPGND